MTNLIKLLFNVLLCSSFVFSVPMMQAMESATQEQEQKTLLDCWPNGPYRNADGSWVSPACREGIPPINRGQFKELPEEVWQFHVAPQSDGLRRIRQQVAAIKIVECAPPGDTRWPRMRRVSDEATRGRLEEVLRQYNGILGVFGNPVGCNTRALSPDKKWYLRGDCDCKIRLWNLENMTYIEPEGAHGFISKFCFSPDSKYVAGGFEDSGADPQLFVWDVETGELVSAFGSFHAHQTFEIFLSFSEDGNYLACTYTQLNLVGLVGGRVSKVWDVRELKENIPVRFKNGELSKLQTMLLLQLDAHSNNGEWEVQFNQLARVLGIAEQELHDALHSFHPIIQRKIIRCYRIYDAQVQELTGETRQVINRPTMWQRACLLARRRPLLAATAAVVGVAGIGAALWKWFKR